MGQEHDDYGEAGSRPRRSPLRRIVVGIALFLVAYAGSYLALLSPGEFAVGGSYRMDVCRFPSYRVGGEYAHDFYRPAHWADRRVRPDYWAWRVEEWWPDQP
jgi:hypothetical protein